MDFKTFLVADWNLEIFPQAHGPRKFLNSLQAAEIYAYNFLVAKRPEWGDLWDEIPRGICEIKSIVPAGISSHQSPAENPPLWVYNLGSIPNRGIILQNSNDIIMQNLKIQHLFIVLLPRQKISQPLLIWQQWQLDPLNLET